MVRTADVIFCDTVATKLDTGVVVVEQVGPTEGVWHYDDVNDVFAIISNLRKQNKITDNDYEFHVSNNHVTVVMDSRINSDFSTEHYYWEDLGR